MIRLAFVNTSCGFFSFSIFQRILLCSCIPAHPIRLQRSGMLIIQHQCREVVPYAPKKTLVCKPHPHQRPSDRVIGASVWGVGCTRGITSPCPSRRVLGRATGADGIETFYFSLAIKLFLLLIEPVWNQNQAATSASCKSCNSFNRTSLESKHVGFVHNAIRMRIF